MVQWEIHDTDASAQLGQALLVAGRERRGAGAALRHAMCVTRHRRQTVGSLEKSTKQKQHCSGWWRGVRSTELLVVCSKLELEQEGLGAWHTLLHMPDLGTRQDSNAEENVREGQRDEALLVKGGVWGVGGGVWHGREHTLLSNSTTAFMSNIMMCGGGWQAGSLK
jgi:hypothetical protein